MAAPRQRDGHGGTELATTIACGVGPAPSLRGEGKVGQSDSCCKYQGVRAGYLTSSLMEREARRDLSANVSGSVPGCLRLHACAGQAQQHALSQPCASPGVRRGHSHPPSPHTSGLAGGPATAWHGSARGSGTPGAPGDGGSILNPTPTGVGSPAPRHVPAVSARASPCPTDTCGSFLAPLPWQEVGRDPLVASLQAPVMLEDVEVRFSAEEWELLEEWQRELHREVTEGTSRLLASLGPPGSPALGALVRLVKEIPEFLFGGPKGGAEPGATSSGDAAAGSEQTGAGGVAAEGGSLRGRPACLQDKPPGRPWPAWSWATPGAGGWQSLAVEPGTGHGAVKMEAPVESCPLRSLEKCLEELAVRGSGHPAAPSPPASGSRAPGERQREEPGSHQSLPGRRLLRGPATAPGALLAESPAALARCCPQSGDGSTSGISSTGSAEAWLADAVSPPGSGMCPGSCGGMSLPKKRCPGIMSPPLPWETPSEAQDPRPELGRVRAVPVEELERLCQDLGSVRREAWGMRSRLERLERGQARKMAALARSHRHLRHAVRRLEGRCWELETRSRPKSLRLLRLAEEEEGDDVVGSLQTVLLAALGLLPAPAPLQMESGPASPAWPLLFSRLRSTDKLALVPVAHRCPEPHSWAGTRLAIIPAACPPGCQDPLAAGRWAWRAAEPRCPAAGHGRGSAEP